MALMAVAVAAGVSGQTFEVSPGQLAAGCEVPSHAATITVRGAVDASDLDYLTRVIEDADVLDLSGAEIAAYKGKQVGVNTYSAPANVLPPYIFAGLKASHVKLPAALEAIGEGAFIDSRVEEVSIPAGVKRVGADAFGQCARLTRVELPSGIDEVAARTFEGCAVLAEVKMPEGLRSVGARAFLGCGSLKGVDMPASLTSIAGEAFAMSGLEAAALGGCSRLDSIGDRAFASCRNLTTATLPSGATRLGEGIFFECVSLLAVSLPAEAVNMPALTLKGAANVSAIELPEGLSGIGDLAMAGMSAVERVTLPESLEHIGDGAFEGWSGVREIDAQALEGVPALGTEVWAGVEQPTVALIVPPALEDAFLAAPQWQDFAISRSAVTSVTDAGDDKGIEAAFYGRTLRVTAAVTLKRVTVYGLDGRVLAMADNIDSESVSIDTADCGATFFIVRAETGPDPKVAIFKLMREP